MPLNTMNPHITLYREYEGMGEGGSRSPVKIKLFTFWMLDRKYEKPNTIDEDCISHGVWQTVAVEEKDNNRIYTLQCAWPMLKGRVVGEQKKMYSDVILALCHPVELTHLPKIEP